MTPTERDKELRDKIADLFDELCEPTNKFWHRDSGLYWANKVMELITADRKRVALEARLDELRKMSDLPYIGLRAKRLERLGDRAAELKAKQEEV